jgi:hypothetical protein
MPLLSKGNAYSSLVDSALVGRDPETHARTPGNRDWIGTGTGLIFSSVSLLLSVVVRGPGLDSVPRTFIRDDGGLEPGGSGKRVRVSATRSPCIGSSSLADFGTT